MDFTGNRSPALTRLPYLVDNIGLQITVTGAQGVTEGEIPVLAGAVNDNSGVDEVWIMAQPLAANGQPTPGTPRWEDATLDGGAWSYTPDLPAGRYRLFVLAVDRAGNASEAAESYPVLVGGVSTYELFLPLVRR